MVKVQVDDTQKGIWRYFRYFPKTEEKFWLSLDEGSTPVTQIEDISFKREDLNPTGSLKDRGLAYQISKAYGEGEKKLVISSSGNAAISAAAYCRLAGISLSVFASDRTNLGKLGVMREMGLKINFTKRPVSDAVKFAREYGFKNLRPSLDPVGIEGYKTIAFELFRELGKIDDIFIPVSSATCLIGISEGFKILGFLPRFHACQSTKINTIAAEFDKDFVGTRFSLASALVAKVTAKKDQTIDIVNKSKGWGWVIGDIGVQEATRWLEKKGIETSAEGALALAAVRKAQRKGFYLGKTVCLLTGRRY